MKAIIVNNFNQSMSDFPQFELNDNWIFAQRGPKNTLDPQKPYACFCEKERTPSGATEEVATIFLTNRECPFRCLMCDLWKNTTASRIPAGAISQQIEWALTQFTPRKHLKLYNSGSFFDGQAIPPEEYPQLASLLSSFETLTVECHPKLIDQRCLKFKAMIKPELHIAMGLETVHPEILPRLNKRMDLKDFEKSVQYLMNNKISVRAFILLRPPFLTEVEGILWAKRSIDFAFKTGVECCVVIPTRTGNGALEWLQHNNYFSPPHICSLENVLEYGIQLSAGRVFADLWDIEQFASCQKCLSKRKRRLLEINLTQEIVPPVKCDCNRIKFTPK